MSRKKQGRRSLPGALVVLFAASLVAPRLLAAGPAARPEGPRFTRTVSTFDVPDVPFVDQDGRRVGLRQLLDPREPVVVNFFFASCGSICPVMTATLARMREALGREGRSVKTVSITIDPDQDTPDVLKEYAARFSAGPGWSFLTGEPQAVAAAQKAFGAETGNKFAHRALFYFRPASSRSWVQIDGLAAASDLVAEARGALAGAQARR